MTSEETRQERVANKVGIAELAKAVLKIPAFMRRKDVSGWAKAFVIFSGAYFICPIDIIPDIFLPPLGYIDDVAIIGYALKIISETMGKPEHAEPIDVDAKVVDE